jgi:hypothetical protein
LQFLVLLCSFFLGLAIAIPGPAAGHDFYLEPSSFEVLTGQPVAIVIGVGHAFDGAPLPFAAGQVLDFSAQAPGARSLRVSSVEGASPAGIVRFEQAGLWSVVYRGRPWQQSLSRERFSGYLAEVGRMDLALQLDDDIGSDEAQVREDVHRCARTMIQVTDPLSNPLAPAVDQSGGQDASLQQPSACHFEIVPIETPTANRSGASKLESVQVLKDGQPVAGARVLAWTRPVGEEHSHGASSHHHDSQGPPRLIETLISDSMGMVELAEIHASPLATGPWLLAAVDIEPPQPGATAWQSWWSSLSFVPATTRNDTPAAPGHPSAPGTVRNSR